LFGGGWGITSGRALGFLPRRESGRFLPVLVFGRSLRLLLGRIWMTAHTWKRTHEENLRGVEIKHDSF